MNTFTEEQKSFVIESLKSGMGIGHIVDDLIEIYGIEVDDETRERLYRRVQKVKSKLKLPVLPKMESKEMSDKDAESDILSSVSPQWRLSYLRALLRWNSSRVKRWQTKPFQMCWVKNLTLTVR